MEYFQMRRLRHTEAATQLCLSFDTPSQSESCQEALQLRERLHQSGPGELSNGELLSLILSPSADTAVLLTRVETLICASGGLVWLMRTDYAALRHEYGLSEAKAAQLQAVLELARRLMQPAVSGKYQIVSPEAAAKLVMADMAFLDHEEIRVLVLDTKNNVLANIRLYQGTLNSTCLRAVEVYRPAIIRNAAGIMVVHNHPSGDPTPSPEDQEATSQLVEAGKLLDIDLVDHIIIGHNRYVSLRERMRWQ
jgi:DNA repair protein RadC